MHALEQLKEAQEEVQAKTSEVEQYKKQHDQATAKVWYVCSCSCLERMVVHTYIKYEKHFPKM